MRWLLFASLLCFVPFGYVTAEPPLRESQSLSSQLASVSLSRIVDEVQLRGDPRRGAVAFFRSAAACANCHHDPEGRPTLGPNLAELGKEVTAEHVIESLLEPEKQIDEAYRSRSILMADGTVSVGLIREENDSHIILRGIEDLSKDVVLSRDEIEAIALRGPSIMPGGLVASLRDMREFLDLAAYVIEITQGGPKRAMELQPRPEEIAVPDDSADLDHAGIIKRFRSRDFDSGEKIFQGYCFNCHGRDGNTPSLPTARAFGTQKLKFGSDPYSMFMTLTRGNGLMAPMSHLTPAERYQVVYYIREHFMRGKNPGYEKVDREYLESLPKGTKDGTEIEIQPRDFGVALASQLERTFPSVLTVNLGPLTISYDLHRLNQAGIWKDGFLDLSNTQHHRPRGEGTADPQGRHVDGLSGWQWGHDGTLDYPQELVRPRAPMPREWMHYRGHYLYGDRVLLSYEIDGRPVLESPSAENASTVRHRMRIGPGRQLVLAVGQLDGAKIVQEENHAIAVQAAEDKILAVEVLGEKAGLAWSLDAKSRLVLTIGASDKSRDIEIVRWTGEDQEALTRFRRSERTMLADNVLDQWMTGGPMLWPGEIKTVGYQGFESGGYALDTITIPDATPFHTWFRTSALDFFPDGRMVVATYGGDIWIVSGIDETLLDLKWKRFAAGLYEPFGVKVVDGNIYVTCKDRLTRLHDVDGNGEADFYESFSADEDVSVNFHAFNFDLQTDNEGNFYYAKSGHGTDSEIPGAVMQVSADGQRRSLYSTGFRTPNGMGSLPDGRVTVSDNQGQWTPASKINLLKPGGYYGWVGNYSIPGMWAPGGGTIDLDKVVPPETFDPPLVWMPQDFDNSSGGQLYVDDQRWGPLSGRLLHTSFGKGWMSYAMIQDFDHVSQAAIIRLPFDFRTGIMRAQVNPADGQVYATGLQGWNGGGRAGLLEKGIQRLRYTGRPHRIIDHCAVEPDGLRIEFNFALDPKSATDVSSYTGIQWDYRRAKSYGSDRYLPGTQEKGTASLNIDRAELSDDAKAVKLVVPTIQPVDQIHLILRVQDAKQQMFEEEVYWTVNHVPAAN